MVNWILHNVAVGSSSDAANTSLLKTQGITAILNVRADEDNPAIIEANEREKKYCNDNDIKYCHLPVRDFTVPTDEQLVKGVFFIEKNVRVGRRVLVHCGAGLGRSPAFVASYLIFKGCETEESIASIKQNRPMVFEGRDRIHIARIKEFQAKLSCRKS